MGPYARFRAWWLQPSRFAVARWERSSRRGERFVAEYEFPAHLSRKLADREPRLGESWDLVERGLREWFSCSAWRGATVLGVPSRAVDEAWHEFILDTIAYSRFCQSAFGAYLHHTPDEAMSTPMPEALVNTVRAWDRSEASADGESVLWDLDRRLGAPRPLGVGALDLSAARTGPPPSPAAVLGGWAAGGAYAGDGFVGGGGGGGGGGCGGCGGCGGNCGGGGGCGGGS